VPCRSQREHRLRHPSTSSEAALLRPQVGGGPRASLQCPHAAHHRIQSFAHAGAHGGGMRTRRTRRTHGVQAHTRSAGGGPASTHPPTRTDHLARYRGTPARSCRAHPPSIPRPRSAAAVRTASPLHPCGFVRAGHALGFSGNRLSGNRLSGKRLSGKRGGKRTHGSDPAGRRRRCRPGTHPRAPTRRCRQTRRPG
jgi:hypothetical protein